MLGAQLSARGFTVDWNERGLRVINSEVPECCPFAPLAEDTITCRRRPEDFGMVWFWTARNEPIAPADRIADAIGAIMERLGHRHEPGRAAGR
ncbi:hypothetical protein [Actinomadura viridis]|uniref:Uncharacterized protein n=1 Tax=Actinomadura viridis TaxID=58110 RepID=A0A931GMB6_9ACTN|nr:hypothetical protein [Actinomadura viridis]MBG6092462.1 hypothetical protein [Actinomadura viridis]